MRRSKFNAVRTTLDGIAFASKKEAARYAVLLMLHKAGKITNLGIQPEFILETFNRQTGEIKRVGRYLADFAYQNLRGETIVEDVKGVKTPVYRLKKKLVEAQYGITITEI